MAKLDSLVADQPTKKNTNAMLKSPNNSSKKAASEAPPKLVAVIKNEMTEQEMNESGEHWVNHQGPYMTVAETLAHATTQDKKHVD